MKFKFDATQVMHKYFEVEANNEEEAFEKADKMLDDGDVRFDDESFLQMEIDLRYVPQSHPL